jgi:precorrin-6B methylase 2
MKRYEIAIGLITLLGFGGVAGTAGQQAPPPQAGKPAPPPYETREDHDPDGIGKFYMGREIAQVMGHLAADWLDRPERESEEATSLLLRSLKIKPGMAIADIGAGSGYFTFPMAQLVGRRGKIYATDIQQEMLDIIAKRQRQRGLSNIELVLGTIKDAKLPPQSVDMILLVDVYHEFDYPYEMTESMIRALKPGGRIVFVEYRKEDPNVPIKELHKMSVAQVKKEMAIHPVQWVKTINVLPRQHILLFEKPRPASKTAPRP